ncbi:MAG TPA: MgtC/SapB family protein [Bacteroidales bacterium]|jgi:putative Mg2+ transporter-C (MgtC) family protein|nr:MgtC/SapB family protein [Bacteroidales bacterium]
MTYTEFTLRLFVGVVSGIVIGMEREWQKKPAGIRTNTLVATGSALFVLLSFKIAEEYPGISDVGRIIGQVVTGIGFLGAGIIFKEGGDVHGLTTAATIWCSAAVGCFAGAGFFVEVAIGVVAILFVNLLLIPLDRWLSKRAKEKEEKS